MRTLLLLFVACALSGIAVPVPEDVPLLAAGMAMVEWPDLLGLAVAGALGVFCRDAVFFMIGHVAGESVLERPIVKRLLGESRIDGARELVRRRGGRAVLAARFLVGFRSAAFLVAGAMGVRVRDFALWDGLGVLISVPLMLVLGAVLGVPLQGAIEWILDHRLLVACLLGVVALAWVTKELETARTAEGSEEAPAQ